MSANATDAADVGKLSRKEIPRSHDVSILGSIGMLPKYGTLKSIAIFFGPFAASSEGENTLDFKYRRRRSGHVCLILSEFQTKN